ncbi:hypothetical protein HDU76_007313, partial [Blyttiomyces sp. JEL0837]
MAPLDAIGQPLNLGLAPLTVTGSADLGAAETDRQQPPSAAVANGSAANVNRLSKLIPVVRP